MKKITLLSIGLLIILSCDKDESNSTCGFNDTSFIGKWKATKIVINGRDSTSTLFALLPCYKTLITEFKNTKIVSQSNEGKDNMGMACDIEADKNWKLYTANSKNYLIVYDASQSDTSLIESITCYNIVSTQNQVTLTLTKQ
jgi:hypothetical protein